MKKDPLQREIIRCILANLGAAPPPNLGKRGITVDDLKTKNFILAEYENGVEAQHPVWAGEALIEDKTLRAVVTDLSTSESYELAAILQIEGMPMYALRLCYDDFDDGTFVLSTDDGWTPTSNVVKAKALIGTETLKSFGIIWHPCTNLKELLPALKAVSEM